jgi:hypothetical protein
MVYVPPQLRRVAWIAVSAAIIGFSYWLFFSGAAGGH